VLPLLLGAAFSCQALAEEVLEEVVVTAQKRTERLQDVPISITAISGSQLENRGIQNAGNLNALAPNVTVKAAQPGAGLIAALSIRGIGGGQPGIWSDNAIGMYLDGVYVGKTQGALLDLLDLERVELLRGPQGTLFGKNTEGGAINFITRKPSGEFGGNVGVEMGTYGHQVVRAALDLPKMGMLRMGFSLRDEQRDGTVDNPTNGRQWNDRNRQAQRVALGLDISPAFKVDYAYDHTHINETPTALSLLSENGYASLYPASYTGKLNPIFGNVLRPALAPYANSGYPSSIASTPGRENYTQLDVNGQSLIVSYVLNPGNTVKYIVAKRKMHYQEMLDLDGSPVDVFSAGKNTYYDTTSHEVQWIGSSDRLNYVAGLYSFKDDGATLTDQMGRYFTFGFAPAKERWLYYRTQTYAKAVYGQLDYKLMRDLTGTLGVRRSWEERQGSLWSTEGPLGNPAATQRFAPQAATASFSATTPVAALSYKLNEKLTVFGRYAKGFKSGGFPLEAETAAQALRPFNQENSTSFELGVKSVFNDGKAQLNATLFSTDVHDYHINQLPPGGISPVTVNAGKLKSEGLEVEGFYQLADGWRLQASYGYLHMKFKEYDTFNQYGALVNVAENTVASYAPRHQLTLNLDGRLARTDWGTLRGIVDYSMTPSYLNYHGQRAAVGTNVAVGNSAAESTMPALQMINARLLLSSIPLGGPGKAEASLWVRNLGNLRKETTHVDVAGFYRVAGWTEPRMMGVSLGYKW
jgi:iron complex outermembrane receptor protein